MVPSTVCTPVVNDSENSTILYKKKFIENFTIHSKKNLHLDTTISSNKSSYQKYYHLL